MTPFASVTSIHKADIDGDEYIKGQFREFVRTGDHQRLDEAWKLSSWQERVRNDITQRDGFATR